jgi:3-methylcrotonyl-CoA carboxylase alpha subunit
MFRDAQSHTFTIPDPFERSEEAASKADTLRAPMPGLVKIVKAAKGDAVSKGQPLLVLEAMKMEHTIVAPRDAVLAEIVSEGAQVTDGSVLVWFAEANEGAAPAKA